MKLESFTISNFRAFTDEVTIRVGELTTIIGRNDVGKSSALEALEIFFNNETVKIDAGDCNVHANDKVIEITCEFSDLPSTVILDAQVETTLGAEYLLTPSRNLRIKKRYRCNTKTLKEEVFVCANHPSALGYQNLLQMTQTELRAKIRELAIVDANVNRNSNPAMRAAIWSHCPDLILVNTEISVAKEDGKRIWEKLEAHLPLFALFQSDRTSRDSDAEVQDPLKVAIATALGAPEIQQKLADIVDAVKIKAVDLANRTHTALKKLDEGLASQLTPEFKAEPKWNGLFSLSLNSDDGIPVNKRGSGVRRMILVSFFRAEAERRVAEGVSRRIIFAIEEPETSQHPTNQKILLESFQNLSTSPNCQVMLTTHSPGFASFLPVDSFRFVNKDASGKRTIEDDGDPMIARVASALGVVPDNRVRALICVEGPTDITALKCLSRALHASDPTIINLESDPRVAFVLLGGSALTHWVNEHFLRNIGRPEFHIYDRDVSDYIQACATVNSRNDGSWGVLTTKMEIENYLHPDAIYDGIGIRVAFGDNDDVPNIVGLAKGWKHKTAKKKLAAEAFPRMTAARIRAQDSAGEIEGWLRRIAASI
jgi:putative ATP-dependent endonuclease of the OLD family